MKIVCSKDNLVNGVQIVQRAVSSKNTLPILSGILIKTEGDTLKLTATDLEIGIECRIPVTVIEEGSVVLPARYLGDIVRRLPDTKIEIITNQENFSTAIKYGKSEFTIHGLAAEDFPLLPDIQGQQSFSIKADLFINMIKQVVFATSVNSNRPIFTGALLTVENDDLIMVATDTHRVAFCRSLTNGVNSQLNVIIPGKSLNEISRIMNNDDDEIKMTITDNQILFEGEGICLISRLIEGQFPNYQQVLPQGYKSKVKINTRELIEAAERAALLARDGSSVIKLEIKADKLMISSNTPDIGRAYEEINVNLVGEDIQIAFNSKYLLDALKVIDTEEIYLELNGPLSPGVLKPVNNDNYIYLILPIRTV
ncbi:MAG: DNA polymerase III subunit beta [Clostridia bacterium]|nr:DNA polymerase III subunit beta [Clostridia bacterium]